MEITKSGNDPQEIEKKHFWEGNVFNNHFKHYIDIANSISTRYSDPVFDTIVNNIIVYIPYTKHLDITIILDKLCLKSFSIQYYYREMYNSFKSNIVEYKKSREEDSIYVNLPQLLAKNLSTFLLAINIDYKLVISIYKYNLESISSSYITIK